jgi:hypothetical protein
VLCRIVRRSPCNAYSRTRCDKVETHHETSEVASPGQRPRSEGKMSAGGWEDTGKLQCHGTDKPSFRRPFI